MTARLTFGTGRADDLLYPLPGTARATTLADEVRVCAAVDEYLRAYGAEITREAMAAAAAAVAS